MTPGQFLLKFYHQPVGRIRHSFRNGGPFAERETERQRQQMVAAAAQLRNLPIPSESAPTLHLMTGRRFWYQTLFCLHSFVRTSGQPIRAEIYDDGSLDETSITYLRQQGLAVRIHSFHTLQTQLNRLLPRERFPVLRERWDHYPNIRKLIDVHLGGGGWKLVMDSDLLFFRRADAILGWATAPDAILHAIDCEECYGYSRALLERLAGAPLPSRLNVGICGLRSDALDWEQLECWTSELQRLEGTHYFLEQALVAMLAARQSKTLLPAHDYITRPDKKEVMAPTAVMHHYVDTSKRWYFRYGWRHLHRQMAMTGADIGAEKR